MWQVKEGEEWSWGFQLSKQVSEWEGGVAKTPAAEDRTEEEMTDLVFGGSCVAWRRNTSEESLVHVFRSVNTLGL